MIIISAVLTGQITGVLIAEGVAAVSASALRGTADFASRDVPSESDAWVPRADGTNQPLSFYIRHPGDRLMSLVSQLSQLGAAIFRVAYPNCHLRPISVSPPHPHFVRHMVGAELYLLTHVGCRTHQARHQRMAWLRGAVWLEWLEVMEGGDIRGGETITYGWTEGDLSTWRVARAITRVRLHDPAARGDGVSWWRGWGLGWGARARIYGGGGEEIVDLLGESGRSLPRAAM
jgi:hypothetical protein